MPVTGIVRGPIRAKRVYMLASGLQDAIADGANLVCGFRGLRTGHVGCLFLFVAAAGAAPEVPVFIVRPAIAVIVGLRDFLSAMLAAVLVGGIIHIF